MTEQQTTKSEGEHNAPLSALRTLTFLKLPILNKVKGHGKYNLLAFSWSALSSTWRPTPPVHKGSVVVHLLPWVLFWLLARRPVLYANWDNCFG